MQIVALTQIRNESKRLREWIQYHNTKMGVTSFFFYLDYPEDDSEQVLNQLKNKYNISYKYTEKIGHYDGNDCYFAVQRQKNSFTEGFNMLKHFFDWVIIFDVDEFITPIDINNFNLPQTLLNCENNLYYLPMFNFKPPFDYSKSIVDQTFMRWTPEERIRCGCVTSGKSIIRGKVLLDEFCDVDIHAGPFHEFYHNNINFSQEKEFRLHQWQHHEKNGNSRYEVYDDSVKRIFEKTPFIS
jgi:hypothetical protein